MHRQESFDDRRGRLEFLLFHALISMDFSKQNGMRAGRLRGAFKRNVI